MKNVLKTIGTVLICGMLMTACGGGSSKKSGLSKNESLGNLPALYADWKLYEDDMDAQAAKLRENMHTESGMKKAMEWKDKAEKEYKEREAVYKENLKAEWAKIDGKEVPFTLSDAFSQTNMKINWVKFNAEKQQVEAEIVAKADGKFDSMSFAYYRVLAKDGSVISEGNGFYLGKSGAVKAGESLFYDNTNGTGNHSISKNPEKYVDFAKIEFIAQSER